MSEISRIQGPSGSPENISKKTSAADADKFQQEMRRKVEKVSETDAEQQKKRKRQEEAEEEEEPGLAQAPTTPPGQVTPFSLLEKEKGVSPLEMGKGASISPLASAQQGAGAGPQTPQAAFFQAPSAEEAEDDSSFIEQFDFPSSPAAGATPQAAAGSPPQAPAPPPLMSPQGPAGAMPPTLSGTPASAEKQPSGEASSQQQKGGAVLGPPGAALPKSTMPAKAAIAQEPGITAGSLEEMKGRKIEEGQPLFEQLAQEGPKKEDEEAGTAEAEELSGLAPPFPGTLPITSGLEGAEKKGEKISEAGLEGAGAGALTPEALPTLPTDLGAAPIATTPYANLHPEVMNLFDRMVGVMTVMTMSGMTETVITLNAPQFASSVFFGTQIIIQEYSTAPMAFNIQINSTPQAMSLFQGNMNDLMAAFQYGKYNFRVNRLETGYLTEERPLFKRKESISGDQQDQSGAQ